MLLFWLGILVALLGLAMPFLAFFAPSSGAGIFYYLRFLRIGTLEASLLLGIIGVAIQPGAGPFVWLIAIILVNGLAQLFYPQRFLVAVDNPEHADPNQPGRSGIPMLASEAAVLGVDAYEQSCAYPLAMLVPHQVVNDQFGERPILVTYCSLCHSAIGYAASARGLNLTFEVAGFFRRNLILRDRQTGSIWQQLTGEAVYGPLKGARLQQLCGTQTSWHTWRQDHPETYLAQEPRGKHGPLPLSWTSRLLGWVAAHEEIIPGLTPSGAGLPARTPVAGIWIGGEARAYPLETLSRHAQIEDTLRGVALVIRYDSERDQVLAFDRRVGVETLSLAWKDTDWENAERGWRWDPNGQPKESTSAFLRPLPVRRLWWLCWKEFFPGSSLYKEA